MGIIKTKLINFYENDKDLVKELKQRKELNSTELIKKLLRQYFGIVNC